MKRLLISAALVAGVTAVAGCASLQLGSSSESGDAYPAKRLGGWIVRLSSRTNAIPGLVVRVGPVRATGAAHPGAWAAHRVVFENVGRRTLELRGTRSAAAMLGPPGHRTRLFATAGLCGFDYLGRGSRFTTVCLLMLDLTTLRPGASQSVTVRLTQGGRGMEPLVAGRYVLDLPFRVARSPNPSAPQRKATVRIAYEVTRA